MKQLGVTNYLSNSLLQPCSRYIVNNIHLLQVNAIKPAHLVGKKPACNTTLWNE